MKHVMRLKKIPFELIKNGRKKIEVRLYDEKRRQIKIGDEIDFINTDNSTEKITTRVVEFLRCQSFSDLYEDYPAEDFGGERSEELLEEIYLHYTKEQEQEYGVLGIRIILA